MRVLIAESGSGYGGTAKYLASLLPCLDKKKIYVEVVSYADGPFIKEIRHQGYAVHLKPGWKFFWGSWVASSPPNSAADPRNDGEAQTSTSLRARGFCGRSNLRALCFLTKQPNVLSIFQIPFMIFWLRKHRVELVHFNNEILTHIPLLIAARLAGVKTLVHLHGWRPFTRIEKWVIPCVDQFITISESGAAYFKKLLSGCDVIAVPNGISLPENLAKLGEKREAKRRELGFERTEKVFLIAGRLIEWKGQEVFLKGLARAAAANPQIKGLVVGHDPDPNQPYLNKLKNLAGELGVQRRVQFLPFQEDVWALYAAADIIVHASVRPEPFGLVLLEAMACKRPVIASRGGGVTDIVLDQATGLLTEPKDAGELAAAMERLAANDIYAAQLAEAGEKRLREFFTMDRNARQIEAVYLAVGKGSGLVIPANAGIHRM